MAGFFDAGRIQVRSRGSAGHIGQVQVGQASIKQKIFDINLYYQEPSENDGRSLAKYRCPLE